MVGLDGLVNVFDNLIKIFLLQTKLPSMNPLKQNRKSFHCLNSCCNSIVTATNTVCAKCDSAATKTIGAVQT